MTMNMIVMSDLSTLSLKEQKEAFVSGHEGTTVGELLLICLSAPIGVWLWSRLDLSSPSRKIAAEALLVLFPMTLLQTNFLYPWGVTLLGVEAGIALWLLQRTQKQPTQAPSSVKTERLWSLTCYRSSVMFLTCVAILAVDFPLFPRRFAKTEVTGYGLMDLGAGSFVVSAGLLPYKLQSSYAKRILPLLVMGTLRFVANKGLDYQEHMSEYGIHWNFFLTLAVVTPLASLCLTMMQSSLWILPLVLMGCYQSLLSNGLQEYIETAPRQCSSSNIPLCDVFAANREGILGCIGYIALYLASHYIGCVCLWNATNDSKQRRNLLFGTTALLWVLHAALSSIIPVSRRSTNITFCVWTLAHNVLLLSLLDAATTSTPPIMDAMNRQGLLVFIVANLLTGLVNISFNTLQAGDATALGILLLYLSAVSGFALLLDSPLSLIERKLD
jgi:phosphatidylinositol glycan class W